MEALHEPEIETFGVRRRKVKTSPSTRTRLPDRRYLRKMMGLSHKPIGTLKVHFTFGHAMVTFDGKLLGGGYLVPENEFQGDGLERGLGVTNMSPAERGLIGIRCQESDEFGPTGEERYGTNLAGKVLSDLGTLMRDLKDGDIIYLARVKEVSVPAKKVTRRKTAEAFPGEAWPRPNRRRARGRTNKED